MADVPIDTRGWTLRSIDSYLGSEGLDTDYVAGILIPYGDVVSRVAKMRLAIFNDYKDRPEGLYVLGVLTGCTTFREMLFAGETHNFAHRYGFIPAHSYQGTEQGVLQLDKQALDREFDKMAGRHVLVVEDIIDKGKTLGKLLELLLAQKDTYNLQTIKVAALLDKPDARVSPYKEVRGDYIGFLVDKNHWVLGLGMDTDGDFRNLAHVYVKKP